MYGYFSGLIYPVLLFIIPPLDSIHNPGTAPGEVLGARLFAVFCHCCKAVPSVRPGMFLIHRCLCSTQPGDGLQIRRPLEGLIICFCQWLLRSGICHALHAGFQADLIQSVQNLLRRFRITGPGNLHNQVPLCGSHVDLRQFGGRYRPQCPFRV